MIIYYAHCQAIYNTKQEERDIDTLKSLGFEVINPANKEHKDVASKIRASVTSFQIMNGIDPSSLVMDYFKGLVTGSDAVAFRGLPDGSIPAGVAKEIQVAIDEGKPVIEIPSCILRRVLTVDQTREYLKEIGQR